MNSSGERPFAPTFTERGRAKPNEKLENCGTSAAGMRESVHNRHNATRGGTFSRDLSTRSDHSLRAFFLPFTTIIAKVS
jgi:hypothetical protein